VEKSTIWEVTLICDCEFWVPEVYKVNQFFLYGYKHGGMTNKDMKQWTFCPFCGKKLEEQK